MLNPLLSPLHVSWLGWDCPDTWGIRLALLHGGCSEAEHTFPFHPAAPPWYTPQGLYQVPTLSPSSGTKLGLSDHPGTSPVVDALLIVEAEKTWQRASSSGPALIQLTSFPFSAWRAGRSGESMRSSHRGSLAGQVTQAPHLREAWLRMAPTSRAMCVKLPVCGWRSASAGTLFYTSDLVPPNPTTL